jgi:hypothetical protein
VKTPVSPTWRLSRRPAVGIGACRIGEAYARPGRLCLETLLGSRVAV